MSTSVFWRTVMRGKYQLRRNHVRLQNQLEALLEEAHYKVVQPSQDLMGARLGACSRRWPTGKPTLRLWLHWPIHVCVLRRHSCVTRSARAASESRLPPAVEDGVK